jgi:hypothetical protein
MVLQLESVFFDGSVNNLFFRYYSAHGPRPQPS